MTALQAALGLVQTSPACRQLPYCSQLEVAPAKFHSLMSPHLPAIWLQTLTVLVPNDASFSLNIAFCFQLLSFLYYSVLIAVQDKFELAPDDNTGVSLTIMAGPIANGQINWTIYICKGDEW